MLRYIDRAINVRSECVCVCVLATHHATCRTIDTEEQGQVTEMQSTLLGWWQPYQVMLIMAGKRKRTNRKMQKCKCHP